MKIAVVGAGQFGQNHCRVAGESERARLYAVVDIDARRASEMAAKYGAEAMTDYRELAGKVDAAIVAAPTTLHAEIGCALMEAGIDCLVEKPIGSDLESANRLVETAERHGRILQVGHLERFNPAVVELERRATLPLFFEIHRLNMFSQRSLDVDVVLDLMIHDVDIVLALTKAEPEEVRAAGVCILSPKVDIANVRLQFANGCVANLTASRVSTERVRKLRLFQPNQYLALDYTRQDLTIFTVGEEQRIGFEKAPVTASEPLKLQLDTFLDAVESRKLAKCSGQTARQSLAAALKILDKIKEHSIVVAKALEGWNRSSNL